MTSVTIPSLPSVYASPHSQLAQMVDDRVTGCDSRDGTLGQLALSSNG